MSLVEATLAVTAWGASFVATKIALREVPPVALIWARFALGVPVMGAVVLARRQLRPIRPREFGYFLLLGFLGIAFHQWLQSHALLTSQATTTGWIIATTPLSIAILGTLFLRERLGVRGFAGILLASSGVLLVIARGDPRAIVVGRFGAPGDVLILISTVNWAVFSVLSRSGLQRHPAALMMFYVMLLGWLLLTALFAVQGGFAHTDWSALTARGWTALLFLGLVCSGVAYIFYYDALEGLSASRVGVFFYLEPLVTVVVAAVLLGEAIRLGTMLGGAIILAGIWLVNRSRA